MAVSTGREVGPQMRLLDVIHGLNSKGNYPTYNELSQLSGLKELFLQTDLSELKKKDYLEEILISDETNEAYNRIGYRVNEKGKHSLERFGSQVMHFISTLEVLYEQAGNEDLYKTIEANRDFLHFGYYKGLITKAQIEKMAKKLEMGVERIWWGDNQGRVITEFGNTPLVP